MTQFAAQRIERTRVVSVNTDSVFIEIAPGDTQKVEQTIAAWEQQFQFRMARVEVLAHRELNINSYIEVVCEDGRTPEIKSKGSLAHAPGLSADHDRLIVNQAVGRWMLDRTDVAETIRAAAAARDILLFTEMRSAPSSGLRVGGQAIGKIARVYRSTRTDLPPLTKDATGAAHEQQLEGGFAYLPDTQWPATDDVDVEWYVLQARLIIAQTSTPYSPHHNLLARQLAALGLQVLGLGGAAAELDGRVINEQGVARGTEKNPRNHSGDRGLAISVTKTTQVLAMPPGHGERESLVLAYGRADGTVLGEIHDRSRLPQGRGALGKLKKSAAWWADKGHVTVYDPSADIWPLHAGQPVARVEAPSAAKPGAVSEPTAGAPADGAASMQVDRPLATPAPLDNNEFLRVVFGDSFDVAFVCSNTVPPDTEDEATKQGMWLGGPVEFARGLYLLPERQNYTCVSSFFRDEGDVYRRQQEYFDALHFVVLDDIGTKVKVDPRTLGFGEPTLINETSPGNFQWIYRLKTPVMDLSTASYLMKEVLARPVQGHLMTDQGAKGVTRLCKLPHGTNLKRALSAPWRNRVASWRPELAYSADEIAGWFGAKLKDAPLVRAEAAAAAADAATHPLIQALAAENRLLSGQQKGSGWWDFECIQVDQHAKGDRSGTAAKVRPDGSWTIKCQHGHCADLTPRDLFHWLRNRGHVISAPQHRNDVKRLDRSRLNFGAAPGENFAEIWPEDGWTDAEYDWLDPELANEPKPQRPTIYIDPGDIDPIVSDCARLIEQEVFKRGGSLVRIGVGRDIDDGITRDRLQAVVVPINRHWLIRELSARANFMRWNQKIDDYKRVDCPSNVAAAVELGTRDLTFNDLAAFVTAPYLRRDGSISATPGYDAVTQVYYAPNLSFAPIPDQPTREQAREALDELKALVAQFPFANDASRSVFLADVLTAMARPTLPTSPAVVYTATMAGTGKTLMASIANLIAYGHATTHPWSHGNDEELKKVFTSILIAGDPVVVFDNVPNGAQIKSAALSQFTTSDEYADRRLGESERVRFKNRTRVVLTGNNITLASDNARRALVCELQLQVASPRDRRIAFTLPDLQGHIKANRARLIVAALTVLRAYAICEQPLHQPPLESFEQWSWRVRDALVWLGEADPVSAVQFDNDGSDDIAEVFRLIVVVAKAKIRVGAQSKFRASELANWAAGNYELRDALQEAGCADPTNSASVGYWLRSLKNRIAGGLRLEIRQVNGGRAASLWCICQVDSGASSVANTSEG